ncbi:YigZ family protein [uncultured Selenomonas sp.]|uniref:YigZ family protein n=1 Tax=uncultured Selenomonas sp. TaxID=159275 RepID=UPI0025EFA006|nr:YigZ family protein [uncultured Selenomonas sp.]
MKPYKTTTGESTASYEIQRSKFITHTSHVESEDEARAFILAQKKAYFDARHNCSAYVLGPDGAKQKSNDDGEPGGTAGNPILEAIKKKNLTNVVVVVTRYFGGIKLGAGGLIRAYSHSAVLGLDAAEIVEMTPLEVIHVKIGYDLLASVENVLRQKNIRTGEKAYAEDVTVDILLQASEKSAVLEELTNLTSGRARFEDSGTQVIAVPVTPASCASA